MKNFKKKKENNFMNVRDRDYDYVDDDDDGVIQF